jgi:hypothetical protein
MVIGDPVCTAFQQAKYVLMIFIGDIERYGYAFHDASSVIARQETTAEIAVFRDYSINRDGADTGEFTAGGLAHTRNLVIVDEGKKMVSSGRSVASSFGISQIAPEHAVTPTRPLSSGSLQRRECPDVEQAEAARRALVHLLPVQQSAPWEPMRSTRSLQGQPL